MDDQAALVQRARLGDAEAWTTLYVAVHPRLRAYVGRRVGAGAADDVVSETMTRAVEAIDRFRWEPAGFDGWLFGIARRVSAEHVRRSARRWRRSETVPALAAPVDEAMILSADQAEVRLAFERLRPQEREVLELRVIAGLTAEQAAAALGRRPGAVRTAQSRALARLRSLFEEGSGD